MESFFSRYRNLVVLLAMLVAQIAGLAMQVRRTSAGLSSLDSDDSGSVRLIRLWANAVISPPERIIHGTKLGVGGVWSNYIDLLHVRKQNEDLQQTIGRLRMEQAALSRGHNTEILIAGFRYQLWQGWINLHRTPWNAEAGRFWLNQGKAADCSW